MRHARLSTAWDKWRDRYKDERLRVTVSGFFLLAMTAASHRYGQENEVALLMQRNLVFRSFGIWLSKTHVSVFGALFIHSAHQHGSSCPLYVSKPRTSKRKPGGSGERPCRSCCKRRLPASCMPDQCSVCSKKVFLEIRN
jgi:hypothetical protein